jgi:hypothetical protein
MCIFRGKKRKTRSFVQKFKHCYTISKILIHTYKNYRYISTSTLLVVCFTGYIHMCYLYMSTHICTYMHDGKDEAIASIARGVVFHSVAGRESGGNCTVLVVSFAMFISTRPDFRDFLCIRSVQNYNRFLVYLTIDLLRSDFK